MPQDLNTCAGWQSGQIAQARCPPQVCVQVQEATPKASEPVRTTAGQQSSTLSPEVCIQVQEAALQQVVGCAGLPALLQAALHLSSRKPCCLRPCSKVSTALVPCAQPR